MTKAFSVETIRTSKVPTIQGLTFVKYTTEQMSKFEAIRGNQTDQRICI